MKKKKTIKVSAVNNSSRKRIVLLLKENKNKKESLTPPTDAPVSTQSISIIFSRFDKILDSLGGPIRLNKIIFCSTKITNFANNSDF